MLCKSLSALWKKRKQQQKKPLKQQCKQQESHARANIKWPTWNDYFKSFPSILSNWNMQILPLVPCNTWTMLVHKSKLKWIDPKDFSVCDCHLHFLGTRHSQLFQKLLKEMRLGKGTLRGQILSKTSQSFLPEGNISRGKFDRYWIEKTWVVCWLIQNFVLFLSFICFLKLQVRSSLKGMGGIWLWYIFSFVWEISYIPHKNECL